MIYICGDSFGVSDRDYGPCWVDLLRERVNQPVINLSQVCASNLMIAQQVDQAHAADWVIVLFTASTRGETVVDDRVIPYSIHSLDHTTPFNNNQLNILKEYTAEFFNLSLEIYRNQCIIESVLQRLVDRGQKFLFDQGGFEHPSFGGATDYFKKYAEYRSAINLWDYAQTREYRPYYHITDISVHQMVADYYKGKINEI